MAREEHVSGVETINRVDSSSGHGQVLRLRMSPHNVPEVSRVEMLADCPIDHPFFVKDKGKCSHPPLCSQNISAFSKHIVTMRSLTAAKLRLLCTAKIYSIGHDIMTFFEIFIS